MNERDPTPPTNMLELYVQAVRSVVVTQFAGDPVDYELGRTLLSKVRAAASDTSTSTVASASA